MVKEGKAPQAVTVHLPSGLTLRENLIVAALGGLCAYYGEAGGTSEMAVDLADEVLEVLNEEEKEAD